MFLSVYDDELIDERDVVKNIMRIRKSFPDLHDGFYEIISEMVFKLRFTKKQLEDAADNLIINFRYGREPNPAEILSWDKKIRLYSWNEIADICDKENSSVWDKFQKVKISGYDKIFYVKKNKLNL